MLQSLLIRATRIITLLLVCDSSCFAFSVREVSTSKTTSTALHLAASAQPPHNINRQSSRRWNGNYKHASKKLCDVSKAKKLQINLSANGITKTLEKKRQESLQHVLTKAVIWKLFMEEYPNLQIEYDIGDPDYLPDVVSVVMDDDDDDDTPKNATAATTHSSPLFWGESGRMKVHKAVDLLERYPDTHIVHCRWGMDIETFSKPLMDHLQEQYDLGLLDHLATHRTAKFTFCSVPLDVWRFIDEETGTIHVTKQDLEWKELELPLQPQEQPQ